MSESAASSPRPKAPDPESHLCPPVEREARRPLKIGIACYPTFGGSGIVATELGSHLARKDYEVHFISLALPYRLHEFSKNIFFHEVVVEPYPLFQTYVPLSLALATKMSEVAENYQLDLLHVHYVMPFSTSAYLARELVKPMSLPVVTTLHGTDITVVGQQPAFYRLTKFTIESSDKVTSVSSYLRDRTIETFGIKRSIEVIPNFVDTDRFSPSHGKSGILAPPDVPILMHASNFRPVKNIEGLIRLFAKVHAKHPCRLVLIGDGPEKARAEQLCRDLGVHRHCLFLGNQDFMEELLPMADVFLLPSEQESFGLVALEAMSVAVPVVASNVGGLPEVVIDGEAGFLHEPHDLDGMAASVLRLLEDHELRRRIGTQGRQIACKRFQANDIVDRYQEVYEDTIGA